MKQLLVAALCLLAVSVNAQQIKIVNNSHCTIEYYLSAADPTCSSSTSTISYSIAPLTAVVWSFTTATWGGTPPGSGWMWHFIKEWNACGPYTWVSPDCSSGVNADVCAVGIPCSGIPFTSCMKINTTCNTCQAVKTQWTPLGGGDVLVNIW